MLLRLDIRRKGLRGGRQILEEIAREAEIHVSEMSQACPNYVNAMTNCGFEVDGWILRVREG